MLPIKSGRLNKPVKAVIYGLEGTGKSTLAAHTPNPLFLDTEGGTTYLDVNRIDQFTGWEGLLNTIEEVARDTACCSTLVIDTADWAEKLCMEHIMAVNKWTSIEAPGYGKGYVILMEEFGRLLNLLEQVIDRGVNIVMTAHAQMRKFEQPDELGAYDRWELKLQKKTAPMVKEWADLVLFANYKTMVVKTEDKKYKAQGGHRVMYTSHHPAWDAKNRMDLPGELPFDFAGIAVHFPGKGEGPYAYADSPDTPPSNTAAEARNTPPIAEMPLMKSKADPKPEPAAEAAEKAPERPEGIPDNLWQLMQQDGITEDLVRFAVFKRGYMPLDAPWTSYDPGFIQGVLVGAWPQIKEFINEIKGELPF